MNTYYKLLDIAPDASQAEVDAAYQRQRARYQVAGVANIDEEMQRIAETRTAELDRAYAIVGDPERRRQYDADLGHTGEPAPPQKMQDGGATRPRRGLSTQDVGYTAGAVLVAVLLIGLLWALTDQTEVPAVGEVNRPAPTLALPTLAGDEVSFTDLRGKIVLVNFWGTWCEPCRRETPALQAAYETFRDEGLVVVGVNLTDDEERRGQTRAGIRAFVEQYGVTYPIALDVAGAATKAFGVYPLPTSYFIDTQGTIRYVRVGEVTAEEVAALFTQLQQEATAQHE